MYNVQYVPLKINKNDGYLYTLCPQWMDNQIVEKLYEIATDNDIVLWFCDTINDGNIVCSDSLQAVHNMLQEMKNNKSLKYGTRTMNCSFIDLSEYKIYRFEMNIKVEEVK